MKKIFIILLLAQAFIVVQAQNVSYETLDKFSKEISQLQSEVNGFTIGGLYSSTEMTFPEENFQVAFHNQLATMAIYKKFKENEVLLLNENIDLSKATDITYEIVNNSIIITKILFPKEYITTLKFKNGELISSDNNDYLEFYSKNNGNKVDARLLFMTLFDLCTSLKKEKGLITQEEINNQKKDYLSYTSNEFIKKYPNSLLTLQRKNFNKKLEEENLAKQKLEDEKYLKVSKFIDNVSQMYKFKERMTEDDFRRYNPEAATIMTGRYRKEGFKNQYQFNEKKHKPGPFLIFFDKNRELVGYSFNIINGKKKEIEVVEYFNKMVSLIESEIPKEFIRKDDTRIEVYCPKINVSFSYDFHINTYTKYSSMSIFFLLSDRD